MKPRRPMVSFVDDPLVYRQRLGFSLETPARRFLSFPRLTDRFSHQGPITRELAVHGARSAQRADPSSPSIAGTLSCGGNLALRSLSPRVSAAHDPYLSGRGTQHLIGRRATTRTYRRSAPCHGATSFGLLAAIQSAILSNQMGRC